MPCSSEEAQVLHVAGLAGRQVTLNIQGDEVSVMEVSDGAAAEVQPTEQQATSSAKQVCY